MRHQFSALKHGLLGAALLLAPLFGRGQCGVYVTAPVQTLQTTYCIGQNVTVAADAFGPAYAAAQVTYSTTSGLFSTAGPAGNDAVVNAPLPFTFKFFGTSYTSFWISSNGNIQFGASASAAPTPATIPTAGGVNNYVALAWGDWDPAAGGTITYGTNGIQGNRRAVVTYTNVPYRGGGGGSLSGQIILNEADHSIELVYTNVNSGGRLLVSGVEDATGSKGLALTGRNNTVWTATNQRWRLNQGLLDWKWEWGYPGEWNTVMAQSTVVTVAKTTSCSVSVTDANGCSTRETIWLSCPVGDIGIASNEPIVPGQTLKVFADSADLSANATYSWTGPNGFTATGPTAKIPNAQFSHSGTYSVTANDQGCSVTRSLRVAVQPFWSWAIPGGETKTDRVTGVARDAGGNVFVCGDFEMNTRIGYTLLATTAGVSNVPAGFIGRTDPAGNWSWAVKADANGQLTTCTGVAVDRTGNVYAAGYFNGSQITIGTVTAAAPAGYSGDASSNSFVAKLSNAGAVQWISVGWATDVAETNSIGVDASGNAYITGMYGGMGLARPASVTFGSFSLPNSEDGRAFVAKVNTNGVWQWARAATAGGSEGRGIAVDGTGNVFLTGSYGGAAVFGSTTLPSVSIGATGTFVAKLNAGGTWQWAQGAASSGGVGIAVDAAGTACVYGGFTGTTAFGSTTLTSASRGRFLAKINASGAWQWAANLNMTPNIRRNCRNPLALDGSGNIYLTDDCDATTLGGFELKSGCFLARFTPTGAVTWVSQAAAGNSVMNSVAAGPTGSVHVTGTFSAFCRIGQHPLNPYLVIAGNQDLFVATIYAPPAITSFTPASGTPGTSVTIIGQNFHRVNAVTFGGVPAASFTFNPTTITAVVPDNGQTGKIGVVTGSGPGESTANFRVLPVITSFSPASGAPGSQVTITGRGLTNVTNVQFNGVATSQLVAQGGTSLRVTVPANAVTGRLTVATAGGTATSAGSYTVAPIITGYVPAQGAPGSVVLVQGLNFTAATTISFAGTPAAKTFNSATQLTVTVPTITPATYSVTTQDAAGSGFGPGFTVVSGAAPTISAFTPTANVIAGTSITITGTNFTGATLVRFHNVNCPAGTFTVTSPTYITATVPVGALTGRIYVATPAGMGQSVANLTIIPPPIISTFSPLAGAGGSVVLLSGTNLTGATSVRFGTLAAASYTVNSAAQIAAVVPAGATNGPITVTTIAGTATSTASFTVLAGAAPLITSLSPAQGLRGSTVVLTGTNFTGVTAVRLGAVTCSSPVITPTQITVTVPATATTGVFSVTTSGGGMAQSPTYTVILPPTITSFTPATGPVGTLVTINGTNFTGATSVTFGSQATSNFTLVNPSRITVNVPAGATTGTLKVTNPAGTATSTAAFTVTGGRATIPAAVAQVPLSFFPNPARERVRLTGTPGGTVELLDAVGRRVLTSQLDAGGDGVMPLQGLPGGVYLLRAAGTAPRRLVVE